MTKILSNYIYYFKTVMIGGPIEMSIFLITPSLDVILNYNQILDLDWGPREKSCPGAPQTLKTALLGQA